MRLRFWVSVLCHSRSIPLHAWRSARRASRTDGENGIEFLLANARSALGGWPFFSTLWGSLVNRSPNMFTLIGLGTARPT